MASEIAVRARGLRCTFGEFVAVDSIDFDIYVNECFGFLGPNGAGKTTTMRMIYRAAPVGSGTLELFGEDASSTINDRLFKAQLGVVPQLDNLDQDLTVLENLRVFARFYGLRGSARDERVEEMLRFADLEMKRDAKVQTLSGGMKRRLMIARGLLGNPRLVVLDEPTTGLDPRARQRIWEKLSELRQRHATLILTTHYMEEAERLCDRIAIMDDGKIIAVGTPQELIDAHLPSHVVEIRLGLTASPDPVLPLCQYADSHEVLQDRVLLYLDDPEPVIQKAAAMLPQHVSLVRRSRLDDVFLRITGHGLEE